jgi:hypothetical protein
MPDTESYFKGARAKTQWLRDAAEKPKKTDSPSTVKSKTSSPVPNSPGYLIYKDKDYEYMKGEQEKIASGMKPKAPSYKSGTRYVPRTGMAKLHKGEAVLNKKQANKYRGAAAALGAGKKKTKKLLEEAGHELKKNPPKVLKQTAKKKGMHQAEKQRIAIMISKARAAGADIPKK